MSKTREEFEAEQALLHEEFTRDYCIVDLRNRYSHFESWKNYRREICAYPVDSYEEPFENSRIGVHINETFEDGGGIDLTLEQAYLLLNLLQKAIWEAEDTNDY